MFKIQENSWIVCKLTFLVCKQTIWFECQVLWAFSGTCQTTARRGKFLGRHSLCFSRCCRWHGNSNNNLLAKYIWARHLYPNTCFKYSFCSKRYIVMAMFKHDMFCYKTFKCYSYYYQQSSPVEVAQIIWLTNQLLPKTQVNLKLWYDSIQACWPWICSY